LYHKNYSNICTFTKNTINKLGNIPGVYELCVKHTIKYSYKDTTTFYIGSSNNLKIRLTTYLNGYAHTVKLKEYLQNHKIYFRFIKTINYKELEKDILDGFSNSFGEYPLMNFNRVVK
jgi:excinuclease UvrABC nuclease subunit